MQTHTPHPIPSGTDARVSDMLSKLPQEKRDFLLHLFTQSYESLNRLDGECMVRLTARHRHQPEETSLEGLVSDLCTLIAASAGVTEHERAIARRTLSNQRLLDLLSTEDGAPALTSAQAAARLRKTPQVLNRQAGKGHYVCVQHQGCNLYPAWQFGDNDYVPSRALARLYAHFGEHRVWRYVAFLRTPQADLDGHTPMAWLLAGGDLTPVERLAKKQTGHIEAL